MGLAIAAVAAQASVAALHCPNSLLANLCYNVTAGRVGKWMGLPLTSIWPCRSVRVSL